MLFIYLFNLFAVPTDIILIINNMVACETKRWFNHPKYDVDMLLLNVISRNASFLMKLGNIILQDRGATVASACRAAPKDKLVFVRRNSGK